MCVGFLETLMLRLTSFLCCRKVARNGRTPSFSNSVVNWMNGRMLLLQDYVACVIYIPLS